MKKFLLCASFLAFCATSAEAITRIKNDTDLSFAIFLTYKKRMSPKIKVLDRIRSFTIRAPSLVKELYAMINIPTGSPYHIRVDCYPPKNKKNVTFKIIDKGEAIPVEKRFACTTD